MDKTSPAYQQIKQYILYAIHNGEWRTGAAIPTEMQLAKQFSVSRMTVNRALKELSEEKVLERRQGSGTFVAQQQFNHTFVEVRNIADDITQTGKTYRAEMVHQSDCNFSDLPAAAQAIFEPNQRLFLLGVIHYADNVPIQYEKRWVDSDCIPAFREQDFTRINASDYLITNVPLVKGHYQIEAKLPTTAIAQRLGITISQPALVLSRYTCANDNRVLTYVEMWHDGENFQFSGYL